MTKRGFKNWVYKRIEAQKKLTIAAAVGMIAVGSVLFLVVGGILCFALHFSLGKLWAFGVVGLLFGIMGSISWKQARAELSDVRYKVACKGREQKVSVAHATSWVWTWAFGNPDSDQSITQWIAGIAMFVPRLFCAAWYMFLRIKDVRNIDSQTTLDIMKILFRRDERVEVAEIAESLVDVDLEKAVRDVSLLDGIVFLTKSELAISLAPRLNEDLEAWRTSGGPVEQDEENLFD